MASFQSIINSLESFDPSQSLVIANNCLTKAKQLWYSQLQQAIPAELSNLRTVVNLNISNSGTLFYWIQVMDDLSSLDSSGDIIEQLFSINPTNFGATGVSGLLSDWTNIYNSVNQYFQSTDSSVVDTVSRAYNAVQYIANLYGDNQTFNLGFTAGVIIPAMINQLQLAGFAPSNSLNQENLIKRNVLLTIALQLYLFVAIQNQPKISAANIVYSYQNQDLMDVANSAFSNYEDYTKILQLNPSLEAAQVLNAGTQILLAPTDSNAPVNSQNVLGTDIYLTPEWGGDFQSIYGINNLSYALGRRLQTTLGSLTYEPTYGSRIPPEIGQVSNAQTAQHLIAFAKAALLQDPRVGSINKATVTNPSPGLFEISVNVRANTGQNTTIIFSGG